jgi:hypothetical protein
MEIENDEIARRIQDIIQSRVSMNYNYNRGLKRVAEALSTLPYNIHQYYLERGKLPPEINRIARSHGVLVKLALEYENPGEEIIRRTDIDP